MQIDQEPSEYQVRGRDGVWRHRVNRKLCRGLAIVGAVFLAFLGWRFAAEGGNGDIPLVFGVVGAFVGALAVLSLRVTD